MSTATATSTNIIQRVRDHWTQSGRFDTTYGSKVAVPKGTKPWNIIYVHDQGRYSSSVARVETGVRHDDHWSARPVYCIIREGTPDDQIRRKLDALSLRAQSVYLKNQRQREDYQLRQKQYEQEEKDRKAVWFGRVRQAFGGAPDRRLTADLEPKVLSNHDLLQSQYSHELKVKLPSDDQQRAEFLAALDGFLAQQTSKS
jgi:hypothetical protein